MGMLFFGITVLGFLRRKAGYVVARGQYPDLAERLGLSYRPSRYDTGVGSLHGTYEGFSVTVDPDEQRRIKVRFATEPSIEMWNHVHNKRPGPGQRSFRPTDRRLLAFFKTAHGSDECIEALDGATELGPDLERLGRMRQLKSLSVTPSGVTAVFDFGNPPYIPSDVVQSVLPVLTRLARVFERGQK